jgi:hypothetical protein
MSFLKQISALFGRKQPHSELERLNSACNKHFEAVFGNCRLEFGRELVGLMDMKKRLLEAAGSPMGCTPVQEMLAKKFLELADMYFGLAHSYVSIKRSAVKNDMDMQHMKDLMDRMDKVLELAGALNTQFYIRAETGNPVQTGSELLDEAEALFNVLKRNE